MEPDQPPAEPSDDQNPPISTTEPPQKQTTTHALRSYECNFCKRGFTNAQALGGHMNIHRKHKNKLKHSSSTTTTPPNTRPEPPSPTTTTPSATNPFSISHQRNWFSATSQDETKPLAFFDHRDIAVPSNTHQFGDPTLQDVDADVDLELRLGHVEVERESSPEKNTMTTRKFF